MYVERVLVPYGPLWPGGNIVYETAPPELGVVCAFSIFTMATLLLAQPTVKFCGLVSVKVGYPSFDTTTNVFVDRHPSAWLMAI